MRNFVVSILAVFVALSFVIPSQVSAQHVFLGGGATFPTGDYGDYADTGWMVEGGIGFPVGENGLSLFVDGLYGSNSHGEALVPALQDSGDGDKTSLLGGFAGVEYAFAEPGEAGLFVFGQVGFLRHDLDLDELVPELQSLEETETGFAFGGGAGYSFPIGGLNGYVVGRFLQGRFGEEDGGLSPELQDEGGSGNTTFFGLTAGVSIPLGGNEG